MAERVCTPEEARAVEDWEKARFFSTPGMASLVRDGLRELAEKWEAEDQEAEAGREEDC